jgi:hypothetical protein
MKNRDYKREIIEVVEEGEYIIFLNCLNQELARVPTENYEALKEFFSWGYRIKCDTYADNLDFISSKIENDSWEEHLKQIAKHLRKRL